MSAIPWIPIADYRPDMGAVLVWLSWPEYSRAAGSRVLHGDWMVAYPVVANGTPVWVTAHDSIPCETTGRAITHFLQKATP